MLINKVLFNIKKIEQISNDKRKNKSIFLDLLLILLIILNYFNIVNCNKIVISFKN